MFAPPVAKPKTKSTELQRATVAAHAGPAPSQSAIEQAHMLQRSISGSAPASGAAGAGFLGNERRDPDHELAGLSAQKGAPGTLWDFSKIPIFSPGRAEGFQKPPRFPAPRLPIQAKLKVGAVDDPLEHEADRVADQVMRMPAPDVALTSAPPQVRRKCAACEEEEKLQTKPAAPQAAAGEAPPSVHEVLRSPGQPLDAATQGFMEHRFGHDFSRVRVHADSHAAASARSVGALAYTVGRDIVFDTNSYAPSRASGKRLLAHELAHVLQQCAREVSTDRVTRAGSPDSAVEGEAKNNQNRPARIGKLTDAAHPLVARQPSTAPSGHCGGTWTCAATPCKQPDIAGNGTPSTSWELDLNIDTDVETAAQIMGAADVGHTYVVFKESNGTEYSFGFYPLPGMQPDPHFHPEVFGCIVHADTTHKPCVDYTERYNLSQKQYTDALNFAQLNCSAPPHYNVLTYNCTTFVIDVAKQAGQSPPSPRGAVGHGAFQADNPNTLKEGYLDQHVPTWRLKSDSQIRDWVFAHDAFPTSGKANIAMLPTEEKVRLLNRLLDGFVSDDDVAAFEKICSSIDTAAEQKTVQDRVGPREKELINSGQKARVHKALFIVIESFEHAPGVREA